ncbi:glycoside hydrolase family 78 protein [Yinghuangia soli]|uniref:alpha-L-rhamnosidase n=1 Tax=Yinghuangia soli TaxID=2908204 RepID=A0AA41U1V5_9ACTN|nr:glycoside hydrolase family 78 protein [Yinghuangia soli]MCF2531133.1 glycoside hydrolase family 78 protein [Yinghuangia soli]
MHAPDHLRVEHLEVPLGLHLRRPRLSWRLPRMAVKQIAYQLRTATWDSGRVTSEQSVLVPYTGPEARSAERTEWQVKVWTDAGESAWSQLSWWETGLLDPADWTSRWIEPHEGEEPPAAGSRPAYLLRRAFTVPASVVRARLYATAHGVYEAFLNGHRVGDLELTPGFTAYRDNLHVQTYDVTDLVAAGPNALGAVLSDGWFRGRAGAMRLADNFGNRTALLCQLHLEHGDGTTTVIGTDDTWTCATGEITAADLMDGETHDLRLARPGWPGPGFDDSGWAKVREVGDGLYADFARLTASPAPGMRRVTELTPISSTRLASGAQVIDLGQNINGWIRLNVPAGDELTLHHGEALGEGGSVDMDHFRAVDFMSDGVLLPGGQVDRVIGAGRPDEVFEPRHTTHGFRYVQVDGASRDLSANDVTGVVVHTDLRRTGRFECSDERVNRLHDIADWSFRGNACDIPTDCPQRERAGWTGDWMLYVPTAAFLYDVAGFSVKWLRDLAVDQWDDGCLTNFAPDPGGRAVQHLPSELLDQFAGSSGWGDASVIVPWELYRVYGDLEILREFRPMMVRWVDFAAERARTRRHPDRAANRAEPEPHEEFLWDAGFHWGEWCEPDGGQGDFRTMDQGAVATAYLYRSAHLLSRISTLTGHIDDAARFHRLAENVLRAWRTEYITEDGTLTLGTQATHVRALAFGLVPDELRGATADRLVTLIRAAGTTVGTGFLATPLLLPVLADTGHLDVAYELLLQSKEPSWLTMLDRGATTVWEEWGGIDAAGKAHASLNHYSKGAVISFLHTRVAGIRPPEDPDQGSAGYRRFTIAPTPGGGLTSARAEFASPYGTIASGWRVEGNAFALEVTVPPGTEADVRLPDGRSFRALPGKHRFS